MHPDSLVDALLSTAFREKQKPVEVIRPLCWPQPNRPNTPITSIAPSKNSELTPSPLQPPSLLPVLLPKPAPTPFSKRRSSFASSWVLQPASLAGIVDGAVPLIFAHLAFWAARILALAAALNLRFLGASVVWAGADVSPPRIAEFSLAATRFFPGCRLLYGVVLVTMK